MNKVDFVLESCSVNLIDEFDESYYLEDGYEYLMETIKQTATGATKKNIFQKIWAGIIRIWKWLCKQWNRFISWITGKSKKRKGADQIFEDSRTGGTRTGSTGTGSKGGTATPPPPPPSPAGTPPAGGTPPADGSKSGKIQSVSIPIESSERSEVKMEDQIQLMLKPLKIRYDKEKEEYGISINDAKFHGTGDMKAQGKAGIVTDSVYASMIVLMHRPQAMEHFNQALDSVVMMKDTGKYYLGSEFVKHIDEGIALIKGSVQNDYVVNYKMMKEFQRQLNDLMSKMEKFQEAGDLYQYSKEALDSINWLMSYSAKIQMSMNAFTRVMQGQYYIDAQYAGTITNATDLDLFVKGLIDEGYPPKVVGLNAYCAASPALRGNTSEQKPIWGQSRAVLFPTDNESEIIKVALHGWGVASNKSEYTIYQKLAKLGGKDYLTATTKVEANGAVVHSERVDTTQRVSDQAIDKVLEVLDKIIQKYQLGFRIDDAHAGNFGVRNGMPVFLDYAWISRTST